MKKRITITTLLCICISLFSRDITSEELTKRLSIDGIVSTTVYNLSNITKFEDGVLKYTKDEQLANISDNDTAYFLSKLHLDITDEKSNIEQIYAFEYFDEDYTKDLWAAYSPSLDQDYIIDKAQNYDEFNSLKIEGISYFSFRLRNEDSGELYDPLFFYVDSNSIMITGYEEVLKKVLTNKGENNYWIKSNKYLFNGVNILDLSLYRDYGYGIIQSFDFDNSFNYIKSFKYNFSKSFTGKIVFNAEFESNSSENTAKIKEEFETLKLDIIDKVNRIKNDDYNKFTNAIEIDSENDIVSVKVTIPNRVIDLLKLNLVYSFTDLLEVYPEIIYDFGDTEEYEVTDYLDEDVIEYKENYHYNYDFKGSGLLDTIVEISEIGYLEDGKNLFITVRLTPTADESLSWQYKYLDFGIKSVYTDKGYIDFPRDYGLEKLPEHKTVGENGFIEQTIIFPEGYTQDDLREIKTLFTFLEPLVVKKVTLTRDDVNKKIALGSGVFTLLEFQNSFIYNFTDMKDSLIEVRALNSKGEALYSSGGGSRKFRFSNGLKSSRMNPYIEGNTEFIEVYYVDKFEDRVIELPQNLQADFAYIKEKEKSNRTAFEVVQYTPTNSTTLLPVDDFFESNIESWPMVKSGPFEVYLRGVSDMWELDLELYIKAPNHDAFKESDSCFEIVIDEVTTNSGDIIERPDMQTLLQWERENNTFNNTFSWSITKPFYSIGDSTIVRERIVLGITSDYGGLRSFKGHIEFNIPEAVTTLDIENLYVGKKIVDKNIELKVLKFEKGQYHLKITKGLKNLVQVRAKNDYNYVQINTNIVGDILKVDPLSEHELYELTISSKNQSYLYNFELEQ